MSLCVNEILVLAAFDIHCSRFDAINVRSNLILRMFDSNIINVHISNIGYVFMQNSNICLNRRHFALQNVSIFSSIASINVGFATKS